MKEGIIMQKKLYRVDEGKIICGVCTGVAEYFNIDVTLVRVAWGVVSCFLPVGVVAYFVAAAVMPVRVD